MLYNLELRKTAVFTKTSRIVGWIDENLSRTMDKGFFFNGANVGEPGYLHFYGEQTDKDGKIIGGDIEVHEFFNRFDDQVKQKKKRIFSSYTIPVKEILFLFDLKPMVSSPNVPEKRRAEQRSQVKDVMVRVIDYGITIKGKTYLHSAAYDKRILWAESKDKNWFILQFPEFPSLESKELNKIIGITKIADDNNYHLDHILFQKNKVSVAF